MIKKILLLTSIIIALQLQAQSISSIDVIANAYDYYNHTWTAHSNNITTGTYVSYYCSDASNKYVRTPDWVNDLSNPNKSSIPYKWGGFSSLQQYDSGITNGKYAGDIQTRHPNNTSVHYSCGTSAAVGLDCSGFTSRCFELSSHYSTGMMDNNSLFGHYSSYNDIQPGDIANKPHSHVRLVVHVNANGTVNTLEEGAGNNLWRIFSHTYSVSSLQSYGYQPQYYVNMSHDGESKPENDDCVDATYLFSKSTCHGTAGTLTGAQDDNLGLASCDTFTGSDSGKGVFYKFLAVETTHQISLTPINNNTDPVVVLYSGDCQNLTELACQNGAGLGMQENLDYTSFVPGNYYYVRVYNYGNQTVQDGDFNICITHTPTQAVYLQYTTKIVSDGVLGGLGNSDGKINAGETINLILQLYNSGNGTAHNVTASISTSDTDISIQQNTISFADITAGNNANGNGLLFSINSLSMAHSFNLDLHIHADEGDWYQTLEFEIIGSNTADVMYVSNTIHDGLGGGIGNYNSIAEPGEEIDLDVYLKNIGAQAAHNVVAILSTTDPDITITDNQVQWGTINSGGVISGSDFDFSISSTCPDKDVTFNLLVSCDEGNWDRNFVLHVQNSTAINTIPAKLLRIYPNPVTNILQIDNQSGSKLKSIQIYSLQAIEILHLEGDMDSINLSDLASGIYLIKLTNQDHQVSLQKFIKK